MRNDFKDLWLSEYRKAFMTYRTCEDEYERGFAFGRCLALTSILTLEYGESVDSIDAEVDEDLLKKNGGE